MSLFCIGLYITMQPGHVFNFIRQPVVEILHAAEMFYNDQRTDYINSASEKKQRKLEELGHAPDPDAAANIVRQVNLERDMELRVMALEYEREVSMFWYLKPFVLCPWCFASTYGSAVFWSLHGWYFNDASVQLLPLYIVSVFGCLFVNAVLETFCSHFKITE